MCAHTHRHKLPALPTPATGGSTCGGCTCTNMALHTSGPSHTSYQGAADTHIFACVCVCARECTCLCMYTHTHTHTQPCTLPVLPTLATRWQHTHVHMRTRTNTASRSWPCPCRLPWGSTSWSSWWEGGGSAELRLAGPQQGHPSHGTLHVCVLTLPRLPLTSVACTHAQSVPSGMHWCTQSHVMCPGHCLHLYTCSLLGTVHALMGAQWGGAGGLCMRAGMARPDPATPTVPVPPRVPAEGRREDVRGRGRVLHHLPLQPDLHQHAGQLQVPVPPGLPPAARQPHQLQGRVR